MFLRHDVDDGTGYCLGCGASAQHIVAGLVDAACPACDNVVAISHQRAQCVARERVARELARFVWPTRRADLGPSWEGATILPMVRGRTDWSRRAAQGNVPGTPPVV